MKNIFVLLMILMVLSAQSQSVSINNDKTVADPSSILDIKSTSKGILLPRMSKTEKNLIASPATGLLVYQTGPDSIGFHYYSGSIWLWLDPFVSNTWKSTGNAGTDTSINFIGTTDLMPLRFKQNNQQVAQWNLLTGNYFLGEGAGRLKPSAMQNSIAVGDSALAGVGDTFSPAASSHSVAIGFKALRNHKAQIGNIAIGSFSMQNFVSESTGGFGSVSIGYASMLNKKTGDANVSIGSFSFANDTIGNSNTGVGYQVFANKLKGNNNTAVGSVAGIGLRASTDNSFFGGFTRSIVDSLVNSSAIGARAQVDVNNAMVLGSIAGLNGATQNVNVAIGTSKPKSALHVSRGNSGNNINITGDKTVIIEDDTSSYIQLLHPDDSESGILSGNSNTLEKSGIIFTADSAIILRTGGGHTSVYIDKTGRMGIDPAVPPNSTLDINGSFANPMVVTGNNIVLDGGDHTVIVRALITVGLPHPIIASRREYVIVNLHTASIQTNRTYIGFNGAAVNSIPAATSITLQSDGANWYRIH